MSLIAGPLAHVYATIIGVVVAVVVTGILFYVWRRTFFQRDAMPGADETARGDRLINDLIDDLRQNMASWEWFKWLTLAILLLGSYVRNGLTVIGLAVVFFVVLTGSHSLLMAL